MLFLLLQADHGSLDHFLRRAGGCCHHLVDVGAVLLIYRPHHLGEGEEVKAKQRRERESVSRFYRVEENHTAVVLSGSLAPDQQPRLGQAVAGQPAEEPVSHHLEDQQGGHQDPVLQPPLVVLRVLAEDGLDGHVAGVEAAHQGDEDLAPVASQQADQHEAGQA